MKNLKQLYMEMALKAARENFNRLEGGPFGACIVRDGEVLAVERNTVLKFDATCHAEINAIRNASKRKNNFDLSGAEIYSTTEPCPMCFSAIHWARIDRIIYGTSIADAKKIGFNELCISNLKLQKLGSTKIEIISGFLYEQCLELLQQWQGNVY